MNWFRITAGGISLLIVCLLLEPAGNAADDAALQAQISRGQEIYSRTCVVCHQPDSTGYPELFPPLAGSDFFMSDKSRAIRVVLNGLTGPVTVNGARFDNVMPPWNDQLSDGEIADVMTFERNSWGNHGGAVMTEEVAQARAENKP